MTEYVFKLKDGRSLRYALYGPPTGWPVVYFHGTPSSRLELWQLPVFGVDAEQQLKEKGLCLIAIDRPGMGLSSFNPQGSFISCAADVTALLHHLHIERCSVLCWSGGGPFALALAHQLPHLVQNVQILCGFSRPFDTEVVRAMLGNKWYFRAARHMPALLQWVMNRVRHQKMRYPPPRQLMTLPTVDYNLLKHPDRYQALMHASLKEACRQDAKGPVYEAALYFQPFGFSLSEIRQPVHYWWGSEDTMVIRLHPQAIEQQIPHALMHYYQGEGHLSVFIKYITEALQVIASAVNS